MKFDQAQSQYDSREPPGYWEWTEQDDEEEENLIANELDNHERERG